MCGTTGLPTGGTDDDGRARGQTCPAVGWLRAGSAAERVAAGAAAPGVRVVDGEALLLDRVGEVDGGAAQIRGAHAIDDDRDAVRRQLEVTVEAALVEEELVLQAGAAAGLDGDAQTEVVAALLLQQGADLDRGRFGERDVLGRRFCRGGRELYRGLGAGHWHSHEYSVPRNGANYVRRNRNVPVAIPMVTIPTTTHARAARPFRLSVVTFTEPAATPLALLLLGRGTDPASERGVDCPGELPPASDPTLVARARAAKEELGRRVFVLGHHYQRDEVIQFADVTGDSFKLARDAAARPEAEYIVFCGVHFMAESADILTSDDQKVVLPDLAAGCSMADMATAEQVAECWDVLTEAGIAEQVVPVSYMNSSADIKAFTGKHGGTICTSSNAKKALEWAFEQGDKVLFLPDQHLGRNTAVRDMGMTLEDCVLYNPHKPNGGLTAEQLRDAKMILWRGHCSVHGRFSLESVEDVRARIPGVNVLVHPECKHEVVAAADYVGSTEYIIKALEEAPAGSAWALGTELNLVRRLAKAHPDKQIVFLDKTVCFCSTMNRIDLPHLVW